MHSIRKWILSLFIVLYTQLNAIIPQELKDVLNQFDGMPFIIKYTPPIASNILSLPWWNVSIGFLPYDWAFKYFENDFVSYEKYALLSIYNKFVYKSSKEKDPKSFWENFAQEKTLVKTRIENLHETWWTNLKLKVEINLLHISNVDIPLTGKELAENVYKLFFLTKKLFFKRPDLSDKEEEICSEIAHILKTDSNDYSALYKKISVLGARVIGADITGNAAPENRKMLEEINAVFLNFLKEQKFLDF